jgi:hypothetical protein
LDVGAGGIEVINTVFFCHNRIMDHGCISGKYGHKKPKE